MHAKLILIFFALSCGKAGQSSPPEPSEPVFLYAPVQDSSLVRPASWVTSASVHEGVSSPPEMEILLLRAQQQEVELDQLNAELELLLRQAKERP